MIRARSGGRVGGWYLRSAPRDVTRAARGSARPFREPASNSRPHPEAPGRSRHRAARRSAPARRRRRTSE
ncbi:protein of unassigned function [Methylobacterium oryzae CBMB20]|uniref:Protein of unassigned function n=1 Tax=Methylobacterium oryzae CBMB20 TaxID=693986 RepID=A0A089QAR9_9HYPH|nr:protein of unassigned function [Methylobacterium oryzae CBMB20]